MCRGWNGRRHMQKIGILWHTLRAQPLPGGTSSRPPEAEGGDSVLVCLPVHAQSVRHHSTSVAEGSSSSHASCFSLAQMKWGAIKKKQWSIWSLSLPEAGIGSERRKRFCPREKTAVLAGSVAYWTGRKNVLDFPFWGKICFPFQTLKEVDFVVSLLLCWALVWEGSQQHRSRLWHMHTLWHGQWTPLIWIYFTPPQDTSLCPHWYNTTVSITSSSFNTQPAITRPVIDYLEFAPPSLMCPSPLPISARSRCFKTESSLLVSCTALCVSLHLPWSIPALVC